MRTAADEFGQMAEDLADAPRADQDQLGAWETGARRPRAATIDLLCRLYATDAQGLGLTGDYHRAAADGVHSPSNEKATAASRQAGESSPPRSDPGVGDADLERWVDTTRRSLDRTLAHATVSPSQLDLLEEHLLWLRQAYVHTPPRAMLRTLLADVDEIQALSAERQPAAVQVRLSEMVALLATLVADALMKLGNLRQSRTWYATARAAADDSGNRDLRARVRAQAAMLPYYYGPMTSAADLARQARLLARDKHTATGAFAAAAEARVLARQGDEAGAQQAAHLARNEFERCPRSPADDAFGFPERRLLLYLSGVHTALGHTRQARAAQQQALRLYSDHTGIDPALLRLEEAICLVRERELSEACRLAGSTYLTVPPEHRTLILDARARHVLDVLPPRLRTSRPARELNEILALPAGPT